MTQGQLNKLLQEWQRRLRLRDWNITARLLPMESMPDGKQGCNDINRMHKDSFIHIRSTQYSPPLANGGEMDTETTLVHELLHLHFIAFTNLIDKEKNNSEHRYVEQAINLIADALVAAKRGQ